MARSSSWGRYLGFKRPFPPPPSRKVSLRSTIVDLLAYGAVTGLVHSVNFYRRLRERERRALFLESNLANARLNMLKAQLQPTSCSIASMPLLPCFAAIHVWPKRHWWP